MGVTTSARKVLARYKLALAGVITKREIDQWRKDLRQMTKIYKSVNPDDLETWQEARKLFQAFRDNYSKWVYKTVLPKVSKDEETYLHRTVAKEAWDAYLAIDTSQLFPTTWDAEGRTQIAAPWQLKSVQDRNIQKYQRAFSRAFKALEEYVDSRQGEITRHQDEEYQISGMHVSVSGYGRTESDAEDDLERYLRSLKDYAVRISKAGFRDAVAGLHVVVSFESKESLTNAIYQPGSDTMTVYPLGLAGSQHGTFVHEVGHRYWFRRMTQQARAHWIDVMDRRGAKLEKTDVDAFYAFIQKTEKNGFYPDDRELEAMIGRLPISEIDKAKYRDLSGVSLYVLKERPSDYRRALDGQVGDVVPLEDVSEYATSGGPIEAFAEVFRVYVNAGPETLGPFTRELFQTVV
jgi:hypothetical protein